MARDDLIQFRRGTAAEWTTANPVLDAGEPGYELDTDQVKIGNGNDAWADLPYFGGGGGGGGDLGSYQSGCVYPTPLDVLGGVNPTEGQLRLYPVMLLTVQAWDALVCVVSAANAGVSARMGVYSDADGLPADLMVEAPPVDLGSDGKRVGAIDWTGPRAPVWLGGVLQGGSTSMQNMRAQPWKHRNGTANPENYGFSVSECHYMSGVTAELPSTFTSEGTAGGNSSLAVYLRAA